MVKIFSSTPGRAPDFMTVYNHHRLSIEAIHLEGRVSRAAVACMLVKIPVPQKMAKQVIDGVNRLCKTNYSLDTVRVMLVEERDMTAESLYGDRPVPSSLEIEPIIPDFIPHVQRIMEAHGGRLEVVTELRQRAHFPPGTIKRFIWPAALNSRYDIYFPDGYCILLLQYRDGRMSLGFDPEEFPASPDKGTTETP